MCNTHVDVGLKPGKELFRIEWELLDAVVVERPNRFVVIADLGSRQVRCHIHDPGRLRELIFPGNNIRIREKKGQKTDYSVVCARDGDEWVITDSRFHPYIARKFMPESAVSEVPIEGRRIDFRCGEELIEVKGCTLEENGIAKFPDAPSIRAAEHLKLLTKLRKSGIQTTVMFLVMRKNAGCFIPNSETDPTFSEAVARAHEAGVNLLFLKMHFNGTSIVYDGPIGMCTET